VNLLGSDERRSRRKVTVNLYGWALLKWWTCS
jgi:hypothetical protein